MISPTWYEPLAVLILFGTALALNPVVAHWNRRRYSSVERNEERALLDAITRDPLDTGGGY